MEGQELQSFYTEEELIIFEEGIFGFEDKKRFLPLPMEEGNDDFLCLLSVDDENVSFLIVNPFSLKGDYEPKLAKEDYERLQVEDDEYLSFYNICVMKETVDDSTVNLKCPVVVNTNTRKAVQVILQTDQYKFKHTLRELKAKEA